MKALIKKLKIYLKDGITLNINEFSNQVINLSKIKRILFNSVYEDSKRNKKEEQEKYYKDYFNKKRKKKKRRRNFVISLN